MMTFEDFFKQATGNDLYPYQERLSTGPELPELLDVPTGLGKTAAAVLAWLWRRRFTDPDTLASTPRRLVYCLPMRVLVEQTYANARQWLDNLGLLAERPGDDQPIDGWSATRTDDKRRIAISLLMGGEDREELSDWALWPEHDAILIGTQDMLLSRALNRGYAASRARWPMEFGLLSNDCLWVFDEVQLMGSGLATSAQSHAFQNKLWKPRIECQFLWMSATLGKNVLWTRDREDWGMDAPVRLTLSDEDKRRAERRLRVDKSIQFLTGAPKATTKDGSGMLDHAQLGRISLVVVNTVDAAQTIYRGLRDEIAKRARSAKTRGSQPELLLVHSRFRTADRRAKMEALLDFMGRQDKETGSVADHAGVVLVSTQVVEAGFDLSAVRLWSEIAPWPSVIQRLGRLNREGAQPDAKGIFWMPKQDKNKENSANSPNTKRVGPYEKRDLEAAKRLLDAVAQQMGAGRAYRDALDEVLASDDSQEALRFEPDAVIRPDDFYGLFSTEPDLAGGFTNISQFVRDQDRNADVQVFWREFDPKTGPSDDEPAPQRDELCSVPFYELSRFLGEKGKAWEWNFEAGAWERRRKDNVFPGMTLLLAQAQGGYSDATGWTGSRDDKPAQTGFEGANSIQSQAAGRLDGLKLEPASESDRWLSLAEHLADVESRTREIVLQLHLDGSSEGQALLVAARWHDWGKSLERWQQAVRNHVSRVIAKCDAILANDKLKRFHDLSRELRNRMLEPRGERLWAKWPEIASIWSNQSLSDEDRKALKKLLYTRFNSGLRHEAASALAAWHVWGRGDGSLSALAVYLIASHHGKVRTVLRSTGKNDLVFGLRESDELKPVPDYFTEVLPLEFDAMRFGATGSWHGDDESFSPSGPSWTAVVSELVGTEAVGLPQKHLAIADSEPRNVGPFAMAYLEALLRAADVRASKWPGKGSSP